ncbi:MAG: hypothetical protein JSS49_07115 [Planctomycetes bacterium]|nr:hypothetical protein [Planctomycetota bacterium]
MVTLKVKQNARYAMLLIAVVALVTAFIGGRAIIACYCMCIFLTSDVPEEQITDQLIVAGSLITARLINDVRDPAMERREYALEFLGRIRCRDAKAVLVGIVNDARESESARKCAFMALCEIDPLAASASPETSEINTVTSRDYPSNKHERTFHEALRSIVLDFLDRIGQG